MSQYTAGELAKLCGVSVRTVQYYDHRQILIPTQLSDGGRRLYSDDDLKKLKTICFLRDTGLSINHIGELLQSDNSKEVLSLLFDQQEVMLRDEAQEIQAKLEKIRELRRAVKKEKDFSVESISDKTHTMKNRKQLRKLYVTILAMGLPLTAAQWFSVILWIKTGIRWPFAVYLALIVPFAIWISTYYFQRVAYVCPQCHNVFKPRLKEAFWANHTPKTRKLTCPCCKKKSFCVEIYQKEEHS